MASQIPTWSPTAAACSLPLATAVSTFLSAAGFAWPCARLPEGGQEARVKNISSWVNYLTSLGIPSSVRGDSRICPTVGHALGAVSGSQCPQERLVAAVQLLGKDFAETWPPLFPASPPPGTSHLSQGTDHRELLPSQ